MATATTIKFGDYLDVTDEGGGVIRVDGCPPGGSGGAGMFESFVSGYWYGPQFGNTTSVTAAANAMTAQQFWVPNATTFDKIGVITSGNSSFAVRLGVYTDLHGYPDTVLVDSGSIAATGLGVRELSATISLTLPAGFYWLAHVNQTGSVPLQGADRSGGQLLNVTDQTLTNLLGGGQGWFPLSSNSVSGALPTPFGTRAGWNNTGGVTTVWLHAA